MIVGLPGSGKTTTATQLASDTGAVRFCPDEWMEELGIDLLDQDRRAKIETLQLALAKDILRAGGDVVIEWGLWGRDERDHVRNEAHSVAAEVEIQYLEVPFDELWRRVQLRNETFPQGSSGRLTYEQMKEYTSVFQPPDEGELRRG